MPGRNSKHRMEAIGSFSSLLGLGGASLSHTGDRGISEVKDTIEPDERFDGEKR